MRVTNGLTTDQAYYYETEVPEEVIFIYSKRVLFKSHIQKADTATPAVGVKVSLFIAFADGRSYEDVRYTDNKGDVVFNIAKTLQMLTNNREKELSTLMYDATDYATWNMEQCYLFMTFNDGTLDYQLNVEYLQYTLINGAHDNAVDWNVLDNFNEPLRLKAWRNYPFTFDIANTNSVQYKIIPSTATTWLRYFLEKVETGIPYQMIRHSLAKLMDDYPNAQRIIIRIPKANGQTLSVVNGKDEVRQQACYLIDVGDAANCDRYTYLRWLGKHGEVFYWLFDNITEDVSVNTETYQRSIVDDTFRGLVTNKMRDNGVIRDSSTTKTRTIATEYLDKYYYQLVSSIIESPYVDMLIGIGENEKWQRVNVADGSFSRSLKMADRTKRNRIVLTIEIPEI
jgi:hypothetical protein